MTEKKQRIDLHTHTTASDGTCTPTELVKCAKIANLAALAVTDHDSVGGVAEATAAGKSFGIEVVPGIELSTELEQREIHIVGLFINSQNKALKEQLEERYRERQRRNLKLLEKVKKMGITIAAGELQEGRMLTRTHIAEVLYKRGFATSIPEALERYLIPGKPLWVEKLVPPVKDCTDVIHDAGGLAFLAHIDRIDKNNPEKSFALAKEALALGMDGIEVRYTTYTSQWEARAENLAAEGGLLLSGGSDFHGQRKSNRLGVGYGNLEVPMEWLDAIKQQRKNRIGQSAVCRIDGENH